MPELATRPRDRAAVPPVHPIGRGRRRGRRVLLGLVVAVLVLGAWRGAPGALLRLAPVSLTFDDEAPAAVVDQFGGPQGAYVVGYEHDGYLDVAVQVASVGLVGVDVVDVRPVLQDAPLLVPVGGWDPVALAAGSEVSGSWALRFDNCEAYHEREAMVVERVEVEARVLGRTVVEEVALDRPLMVRSPMLWQCPDRTLDRGDDRRTAGGAFRRDAP